jgi:DNA (cytosine-5)-methyltransferase 1
MIDGELIVDNFAGGGGASTGIEMATGMSVDIAIKTKKNNLILDYLN